MEIIECKHKIKCEFGTCRNRATHAIKFDRVGLGSRICVCEKCLGELYAAIGKTIVPKSIETAKRKRAKDGAK